MNVSYISTGGLAQATKDAILRGQQRLAVAQRELASGRIADLPSALGLQIGRSISLRERLDQIATYDTTNALVASRLDVTQAVLGELRTQAQGFIDALIVARNSDTGPAVVAEQARRELSAMSAALDSTVSGKHIFAGDNTGVAPLVDYFDASSPAARSATQSAFFAAFGGMPSGPGAELISGPDMQTFLDGAFADLFDRAAWGAVWSASSDRNIESRITADEQLVTSVNANEEPIRKLAQAFTMVADLGVESLGEGAFQAVVDQALRVGSDAIAGLTSLSARVGAVQSRLVAVKERHAVLTGYMERQLTELEGVDAYEASIRVTSIMNEIEVSYAMTARIRKLDLFDYV